MNRESYDAIASWWDGQRQALSPAEARCLALLVEGIESPAPILDLGCGSGHPIASHFAAAGFQIVGVDQSPAMLALAQARLPTQRWIRSEIEHFEPEEPFAAAIAWDSLFHIPRAHHDAIITRIRRALPVGGRLALTAGGSDHPAFTDTMHERTFFYDSHPPAEMLRLIERAGFRVTHQEYLNQPNGARDKGRIAVVAVAVEHR